MSLRAVLGRLLTTDDLDVIVECRQCGMTLSPDADKCPACGSDEIGRYRISQ